MSEIKEIEISVIIGVHPESNDIWIDSAWLTEESCQNRLNNMSESDYANGQVEYIVKKGRLRR